MTITIYTDGACSGNPGPGGWGAVIIIGDFCQEICGQSDDTTNNRMELTATIEALKYISQSMTTEKSINLYTDSQYVRKGITTWIKTWKINGWRLSNSNKPIKNRDLWMKLDAAQEGLSITWHWVKGHSNIPGNVRADLIATTAIKKAPHQS